MATRRFVPLARVARPHGIRGELRLKVYNEHTELLARGREVLVRLPDGKEKTARLSSVRPSTKCLLVRLEGVDTRDDAELVRDAELCVARDEFPPLDEGEFYACDVEGAAASLEDGAPVGRVVELRSYPTVDALVIAREGADAVEVPLTESYVVEVDVDAGRVVLRTLDGLS